MSLKAFQKQAAAHFHPSRYQLFRAPGRINLIGEHTDYNHGYCLPAAIAPSIYLAIGPAAETEVISLDRHNNWYPGQIRSLPDWSRYFSGVLELLREKGYSWPYFKLVFGGGDLPSGAGLSSSSAICCGFISALNAFGRLGLSLQQLTAFSVRAEKASGLEGGMMDQIAILNGEAGQALFIDCSNWSYERIPVSIPGLSWLIADTRVKHDLVLTDYNNRAFTCRNILSKAKSLYPDLEQVSQIIGERLTKVVSVLDPNERMLLHYIEEENARVRNMVSAIRAQNPRVMGNLLFAGHEGLRRQYRVSCPELDFMVTFARNSGWSYGARMVGGGFGGCTIHLLDESKRDRYRRGLERAFKNRFGYDPAVFEAVIGDGVRELEV
ncbi:MAG TPA: galactokinase family protein [Saprospiraceae bacterium]|nr:galactokinase family protein [Saprospiraceae bacterium]